MSSVLDELRIALPGRVSVPAEPKYQEAVALWNSAIERRPVAVVHCQDANDVSRALRFARGQGLELSVRGGGHNFAGNALSQGGLTIDLSPLRDVTVDPVQRRARCGGGARWAELDAACQQHGLAVTGGMISHTGVGGLTLGGGVGWLHSRMGLTCDNLIGAQVVTADGSILRASENDHAELFWALRGGGGNFGVVTEFEFRLAPLGPLVQLGMLFFSLERARAMFRLANELARELGEDDGLFIGGMSAPPAPFVPAEYQGKPCFVLALAGFAGAEAHAARLAAIRGAVPPSFEMVTPIPYVELQKMFDASAPWGALAYEKAVSMRELNGPAIDAIVELFPTKTSPLSFMPILVLGGAYRRATEDAVAFGGKRDTRFIVNTTAIADNRAAYEADTAWVRKLWSALVPHADGIGSYINYLVEPDEARVRASYGEAKYRRLSAIKAKYDPDNLLHLNANIRPEQA